MDQQTYQLEPNAYIETLEVQIQELTIELLRTRALLATIAPPLIERISQLKPDDAMGTDSAEAETIA